MFWGAVSRVWTVRLTNVYPVDDQFCFLVYVVLTGSDVGTNPSCCRDGELWVWGAHHRHRSHHSCGYKASKWKSTGEELRV